MLAAKELLNALNEVEENQYTNQNNNYDFSKVLEFCNDNTSIQREIRCSDGQNRNLSFRM